MRSYFSTRLLWAAFHARDQAKAIEDAHHGERPTFDIKHNGYVLSAMVSSAAFMDAAINEFFRTRTTGVD